jgi:predicted DsbA family dithiol-disulfide isomerase
MQIQLISDVSCPWCVIGLKALEQALRNIGPELQAQIHCAPFELNPNMPAGGQDIAEHLGQKYRIGAEQIAANALAIQQRGAELGFQFSTGQRRRIYNTRAAHRLLHWAGLHNTPAQLALKMALFAAYFTDGLDPSDPLLLQRLAEEAGLDGTQAAEVLASGRYNDEVAAAEAQWHAEGISSVPTFIINQKYMISGGQPVERFERALRQIAAEGAAAA